jgi:hypothetical protein
MSKKIVFLSILVLLFSCSTDQKVEQKAALENKDAAYQDGNIVVTPLNTEVQKGIEVIHFVADTGLNKKEEGIQTSFTITVSEQILQSLKKQDFDALLVDIDCRGAEGKPFSYINTYLPEISGKVVYPDKNIVFTHPSTRNIRIDIPYRKLELQKGEQKLTISLLVYPIKFKIDTNRIETKLISRIGSNALFEQDYSITVQTPHLTKTIFSISGFKIKTDHKKANTYDFTLIGSGLPDPYMQIWCGDELLYFSPSVNNSLTIEKMEKSTPFYTAPKDVISISFLDFDNGPFNRDDLIEKIEGTRSQFKSLHQVDGPKISIKSIVVTEK